MTQTLSPNASLLPEATSEHSTSPGRLVVLTGPSGVGKGTLLKRLRQQHPDLYLSTSATTRAPREGEEHGKDYYFVTRDRFEEMIAAGELLEWAEFAGNYYGTPRQPVEVQIERGNQVILEIELKGARQVAQSFPEAFKIFIVPPSPEELERRIRDRGQDDEAAITRRLARSRVELDAADEFDLQIVNDNLEQAVAKLADVLL
ncbi:guanylate kinase [Leptolyngbya iicbica]|uniref:Guanylate kinase n=2 Tax=Cyanophyceae TaxID=3028117 RepID=A0A4Q7E9N9_9CYAN|nr:guanylate kinase [Leptolyngbya sp. LK]RZM79223.1 guanylate kinase [Leptolyngbya sp. LK]